MAFNLDSAWKVAQTIFGIADVSRRVLRPGDSPQQPGSDLETAGGGLLGHVEARLTGVVISALKEAFDRVHAELAPRYGAFPIFEHCMPFNVQRAWDELEGIDHPRIWTAERDQEMWEQLEG